MEKIPTPNRDKVGPKLMRAVSEGPVDKALVKRAEWMIKSAKVQEYLAPGIQWKDPNKKIAGAEKGVQVVSIGAGKAHEMDEMDQLLPKSTIIGLDPHDYMSRPVEKRLKTLAHNASYLSKHERGEKMESVPDESTDGVTLFFILHHIPKQNHDEVLKEASRILKDDGYVFLAEDLVDNEEERKVTEKADRRVNVELSEDGPHEYRNKQAWIDEFESHGFKLIEEHEEKPGKVRHGFFVFQKREK